MTEQLDAPRPHPAASWQVFNACPRCHAPAGQPCRSLLGGAPVLNPHPGRRQHGPRAKRT